MFAKVFSSIFDSSIADDWQLRIVFQDLLVLADKDGIVDMTPQAISRRTNVPLDIVQDRLTKLEAPDITSRTPDHEGRRIVRLDAHRDWGWKIVNFTKYRESASKEMLRMTEADRKRAYRDKFKRTPSPIPPTQELQIQKQREKQNSPGLSQPSPGHVPDSEEKAPPDFLDIKVPTDNRADWQLRKDREEIRKALRAERELGRPNQKLIDGFKRQLAAVVKEMERRAKPASTTAASVPDELEPATRKPFDRNAGTHNEGLSVAGLLKKVR